MRASTVFECSSIVYVNWMGACWKDVFGGKEESEKVGSENVGNEKGESLSGRLLALENKICI